jgi:hypothetical protein
MYKSKEYNGMDILDSIFSDQRPKDTIQTAPKFYFIDYF